MAAAANGLDAALSALAELIALVEEERWNTMLPSSLNLMGELVVCGLVLASTGLCFPTGIWVGPAMAAGEEERGVAEDEGGRAAIGEC